MLEWKKDDCLRFVVSPTPTEEKNFLLPDAATAMHYHGDCVFRVKFSSFGFTRYCFDFLSSMVNFFATIYIETRFVECTAKNVTLALDK